MFNRPAENQPYIEFLRTTKFNGEESEVDVSSDEDDDGASSELEDEVKGNIGESESEDGNRDDGKDAAVCDGKSIVRLFMEGMTGDEETLEYPDQVKQVASFYEQGSFRESETKSGQDKKAVALIDERNICGTIHVNQRIFQCTGHCRPHQGPLTPEELCEMLGRKVIDISCSRQNSKEAHNAQRFRLESDQSLATNAFDIVESDAERRLM